MMRADWAETAVDIECISAYEVIRLCIEIAKTRNQRATTDQISRVLVPQLMWSKKLRNNTIIVFTVCMFINVGMWLERFVIIVVSLHRDFVPSSWEMYSPTIWDYATLFGSIGLFVFLFFIFIRLFPMITIFEMHGLLPGSKPSSRAAATAGGSH